MELVNFPWHPQRMLDTFAIACSTDSPMFASIDLPIPSLQLRAYRAGDAKRLARLAGVDSVAHNTFGIPQPYVPAMAAEWIAGLPLREDRMQERIYAISFRDQLVGSVGLTLEYEHRRAEIGYWIGEDYRGRGYAVAALQGACTVAFGELRIQRLYAMVLAHNAPSQLTLIKAGFQQEGYLRKHIVKQGKRQDVLVFGLEPPGAKPPNLWKP